jgi:hypothetical protein
MNVEKKRRKRNILKWKVECFNECIISNYKSITVLAGGLIHDSLGCCLYFPSPSAIADCCKVCTLRNTIVLLL